MTMTDDYYAGLARSVLSDAGAKVITAQDYLLKAGAETHIHRSAARILASIRNLQDAILALESSPTNTPTA